MEREKIALRSSDIERIFDRHESPVMGSHFGATLSTGRLVRLLVSMQGQNIISNSTIESIAHKEVGIVPFELHKTYLPLFQEWGFVRVFENKIEENIGERSKILEKAGKFWEDLSPHPVEKFGIELFDQAATAPRKVEEVQKTLDNFREEDGNSALTHLKETGLVDKLNYKDTEWYYSPEIFGNTYDKVVKFLANQTEPEIQNIYNVVNQVNGDQGIPNSFVNKGTASLDALSGSGLLMGYPLTIGNKSEVFHFTHDLKSRFEREGRGDKFELLKTGISHFQFAHKLADEEMGKLKFNPSVLLNKLLEKGHVGPTSTIGTDYTLLVQKGLVKLEHAYGSRYYLTLPDSKEKINEIESIRDAFESKSVIPEPNFEIFGLKGKTIPGDSLIYRSRKQIAGKNLAEQFTKEIYLL